MPLEDGLEIVNTFLAVVSFVLGCMIGSFLNVCICRLPEGESVVRPRSRCPKCGNPISWYDNIPIISWLILGAKCRHCAEVISWQYPLVEAVTGVLFFCVYWRFGLALATPVYMVLVAGLIIVTFIDFATWTIPSQVTYPGIALGIVCSLIGMYYPASGFICQDVFHSLIGVAVGGAVLYLLDRVALLIAKKRGMGFGDVLLLAMLGGFMGWQSIPLILMAASLGGSTIGLTALVLGRLQRAEGGGHYLPFGPYLVAGGLLFLFFGPDIIDAYFNFTFAPEPAPIFPVQ